MRIIFTGDNPDTDAEFRWQCIAEIAGRLRVAFDVSVRSERMRHQPEFAGMFAQQGHDELGQESGVIQLETEHVLPGVATVIH